jgi:cobalt-zinc-cadmium efflux system outer membrane protein
LANAAAADELAAITALLDLQRVMGLDADHVTIALADSLLLPTVVAGAGAADAATLQVAAASAALRSAEQTLAFERHNAWGAPSVQVGVEGHDPTSAETGLLPTVGVSLPFPLFNRNGGQIAVATAERDRARAELALAQRQTQTVIAQAVRERTVAMTRAQRDQQLLASARRVSAMSMRAYQQGAAALPSVLEAERNARDVLAQYVDDVAAANRANDAVQLFTLTTRPQ